MADEYKKLEAKDNFQKARLKASFNRMLGILWPQRQELLSFEEVKSLLQPKGQAYKGMMVVPLKLIVGSEGRYHDFNKQFLPRSDRLERRWTSIDEAHLSDVTLPPIKLFELGGVYFVRDGNHRVSVARSNGADSIDAEVVSLDATIPINPSMSIEELSKAVIFWERSHFLDITHLDTVLPDASIHFTSTGQYDEVLSHIYVHKYFINQEYEEELPLADAIRSWYETVYEPIVRMVREDALLSRFPGRTEADLYVWIVKHWHYLKERYGKNVSPREAASSYAQLYGKGWTERFRDKLAKFFKRIRRQR